MQADNKPTNNKPTNNKPWDAQLAYWLVYPLRNTFITPNFLTTLRLLFGILAGILLATGDYVYANIGACCFVVSHFLDHTDGELARLTGKISRKGYYYDLVSDAIVLIFLFLCIGIGLRASSLGIYASIMGLIIGLLIVAIFCMFSEIQQQSSAMQKVHRQPHLGRVEIEDILYLLPIITYYRLDYYFMLAAMFGTPVFSLWLIKDYLSLKNCSRKA